jgi:putative addiction module CopG family antidote
MMNVELTPRVEGIVRDLLAAGHYHTASEVVEDAIMRLEDERTLVVLRASLDEAEEELATGTAALYTPELVAEMDRNARRMLREGQQPDPDVCP